MEKIFDFENIEKYEKIVSRYSNLLKFNEIFILNRNLNNLSGTESYFEIYEAIKDDINENTNLLEAICMTMNTNNSSLKNIETNAATFSAIKIGELDIKRKNNTFSISYKNNPFVEVERENLRNVLKNFLNEKVFGYFQEINEDIINLSKISSTKFNLSEEMKKLGRNSEGLYDKKEKWGYAKTTDRRLLFQKTIDNCIENFKLKIIAIQKDGNLQDYIDTVEGAGSARVIDLKSDSLIFKKDLVNDKLKFEIINPKNIDINPNITNLIKKIPFIKNVELDSSTDLNKIEFLLKQIENANLATDIPCTFKVRLLGRHNTSSIYIKGMEESEDIARHVVAIDLRSSFSFIKELAIHIDNTTFNPNKEKFIDQVSDYFDKYTSDSQLIGRAAELSYLLNLSKFPELVELIKIKEELEYDDENIELQTKYLELIKTLNLNENITLEELEENFFETLKNNSFSNGLVNDFSYYEKHNKEYFNFEKRNVYELTNIYNYYQKMFNYSSEIKIDLSQTPIGEMAVSKKLNEIRKYKRREGLETYTKEDFLKVKQYIEDGTLTNYTIDELVEDAMVLRSSKIHGLKTFLINEIMDKEARIKNKIISLDTYKEFDFEKENIKDFKISFPNVINYEKEKSKELLEFFKKYIPNRIRITFSSILFDKILDELKNQLEELKKMILDNSNSDFLYAICSTNVHSVYNNKSTKIWEILIKGLKDKELDINKLDQTLLAFARNFSNKVNQNWALAAIGTNLNRFTKTPSEFTKDILETLFDKSIELENQKDKIIISQKLLEVAKTYKIDLKPKTEEHKMLMIIVNNFENNKRILTVNEIKKLIKEVDLDKLNSKIEENLEFYKENNLTYSMKLDVPGLNSLIEEVKKEIEKDNKKVLKQEKLDTKKYECIIDENTPEIIKNIEYSDEEIEKYYKNYFKEIEAQSLGFGGV